MRLAEQQFPLPDAENFDGEVSLRYLLEFYLDAEGMRDKTRPETVSGFQGVRRRRHNGRNQTDFAIRGMGFMEYVGIQLDAITAFSRLVFQPP